jgi:hypothetical protein
MTGFVTKLLTRVGTVSAIGSLQHGGRRANDPLSSHGR